jgi:hypothetical protein
MPESKPDVMTFELAGKIPAGASIQLLRAEVPAIEDPRFALIRYSVGGAEPETGLRLDLDKQTLLDHFEEGSPKENFLREATPRLIQFLYAELEKHEAQADGNG